MIGHLEAETKPSIIQRKLWYVKNKITVDDFMTYTDETLLDNNDLYDMTLDGLMVYLYRVAIDDFVAIEISTNE